MAEPITFEPIGYVRVDVADDVVKREWESLDSEIEVIEPYEAGLSGLDGFSHLIVITFLHELPPDGRSVLQVKPRGLLRMGLTLDELPTIGVFACDSPSRPNPIGVSIVELLGREGRHLRVRALDAFDRTPVLDLKPYTPDRAVQGLRSPAWHEELLRKSGARHV